MVQVEKYKVEQASLSETSKHLDTLAAHFGEILDLDQKDAHQLVRTSFTEPLGSETYFKPNALPYLFKSLQLENKLSHDPDTLKRQLQNTWIIIVDVANLKIINELPDSSHSIGDEAIHHHIQTVEQGVKAEGSSQFAIRFMGDEFLAMVNNPDHPLTQEQLSELIERKKSELLQIAKMDNENPLHNLAVNHSDLIESVVQFARVANIDIPDNIRRSDDMVEIMFAAAEQQGLGKKSQKVEESYDKKIHKGLAKLGIPPIAPHSTTTEQSAVDMIVNNINQTDKIPSQEVISRNVARADLIDKYIPPSAQKIWDKLKNKAYIDPIKFSQSLNLMEESLFNFQFSRNPPILNEWVFNELISVRKDLTELSMYSTILTKMFNMLEGRLAGTHLLKNIASKLTNAISTIEDPDSSVPQVLITKKGASFIVLSNIEKQRQVNEQIKSNNQEVIKGIGEAPDLTSVLTNAINLILTAPGSIYISKRNRTASRVGAKYDQLRRLHYLTEMKQMIRWTKKEDNQAMYNLLLFFMSERATLRHGYLAPEMKNIFWDGAQNMTTFFSVLIGQQFDELPLEN